MTTSLSSQRVARDAGTQQVHFLRKRITYTDNGVAITVGIIPAGAQIIYPASGVRVITAFNDSGTDLIDVGVTADDDDLATDIAGQTVGFHVLDETVLDDSYSDTADITITVTYTGQNSNATAGVADVIILYVPKNF